MAYFTVLLLLMGVARGSVKDAGELRVALAEAKPGDSIVLRDGVWRDAEIELSSAAVTVRAETPGKVVFTGASRLTFAAPRVTVEGVVFRDGALDKGAVIRFHSHHGRLLDSAVINYNPRDSAMPYYWVYFEGSDNAVERCRFERKNHLGPLVGNAIKEARRNRVTESYFKDTGGTEIFRIEGYGGNEESGDDGAFFTIERNLFDDAGGEGVEIISLNSNRNRVAMNTIHATPGGIANRSGNHNTIFGNVIQCEGRKGAYGMRIAGQHQMISSNYIERCDYGIMLLAGEFTERDLTGKHAPGKRDGWVREAEVEHNTVVGSAGADLILGGNYKSGWPASQRVLLPENNRIEDNVFVREDGGVSIEAPAQDTAAPLDAFHFAANRYGGNLVSGGQLRLSPMPSQGFTIWKTDRPNVPSAKPLKPEQVGPLWGRAEK